MEPMLIVFMGAVVGFIVISMMLPILTYMKPLDRNENQNEKEGEFT